MSRTSIHARRRASAAATVLVGGVLLAGCAGASGSTASQAVAGSGALDAPASAAEKDTSSASGATDLLGAPFAATETRSIVITANLTVRVADVAASTRDLGVLATGHAATIASQSTSAGGGAAPTYPTNPDGTTACPSTGCPTTYASSTTTLRVDNDKADALIADLGKLGTVLSSTRTSDDITAQVADVDARVRNAEASLARVRSLMSKATSVGDVVALEGEMSKREADLEALQARQRTYADQSAQATVTVQLLSADAPATVDQGTGFVAGLRAGWDAFTAATVAALTVVGALLPFLVVLVPLGLLARRWWLRGQAPRNETPAPVTD